MTRRPIDLNKLILKFEEKNEELQKHLGVTVAEMEQMRKLIKYLNTRAEADAKLESESEWVRYEVDTPGHPWHCRECNWSELTGGYRTKFYNYCPNCGRKMKIEIEEKII